MKPGFLFNQLVWAAVMVPLVLIGVLYYWVTNSNSMVPAVLLMLAWQIISNIVRRMLLVRSRDSYKVREESRRR
jgi:hypothetical protein